MKPTNYLLLLLILIMSSCNSTKKEQYSQVIEESTKLINNVMDENKIPGLAITVSIDGKNIWSKGFGYADIEQKVPADAASTRFRIGSISKPITSDALIQLHSNGKLHLC